MTIILSTFKKYRFLFLVLAFFMILSYFSPQYLAYSDEPIKADVVIYFVSSHGTSRQREAHQLINERYADYLIIPYHGTVFKCDENRNLKAVDQNALSAKLKKQLPAYRYYETTHVEVLQAKAIMKQLGFKSANLVSSPYHIRRIKLIANREFEKAEYTLSFIATRYAKPIPKTWLLHRSDIGWVMREYVKIFWFLIYNPFAKET
jgi:hypothetical protein